MHYFPHGGLRSTGTTTGLTGLTRIVVGSNTFVDYPRRVPAAACPPAVPSRSATCVYFLGRDTYRAEIKKADQIGGSLLLHCRSMGKPRLNFVAAARSFPSLQCLMVSTFGFDIFAVVRVLVDLNDASAPSYFYGHDWSTFAGSSLRIRNINHTPQDAAIPT